MSREGYVYILTNANHTTLYIGVTNDLPRRVYEHKAKIVPGFTRTYHLDKLVYYEQADSIFAAIEREKKLKRWLRIKKISLISDANPNWEDLSKQFLNPNLFKTR